MDQSIINNSLQPDHIGMVIRHYVYDDAQVEYFPGL